MRQKLGSYKLGQLYADIQDMMDVYTSKAINFPLFRNVINRCVDKLHEISGDKEETLYSERIEVPIIKKLITSGDPNTEFREEGQILTVPYDSGIWEYEDEGFNQHWVGAKGTVYSAENTTTYNIRIASIIDKSKVVLQRKPAGVIPNISGVNLYVNIIADQNKESDIVNLALYPKYKWIDRINKITHSIDNSDNELSRRMVIYLGNDPEKKFDGMKKSVNYSTNVIAYREGENLIFAKGSKIDKYNRRFIHIKTKPQPMVDEEDYIDVPDSDVSKVIDATIVTLYRGLAPEEIKKPIPQELLNWYNELELGRRANIEEKKKEDK